MSSGCARRINSTTLLLIPSVSTGDTLVVTRIDRLARSLKDLQDIVHELKAKGVALKATEQPVDTGNAAGKAFLASWRRRTSIITLAITGCAISRACASGAI
jgi:hypothetical protein